MKRKIIFIVFSCLCVLQLCMAQTNKSMYEKAEDHIANQDYEKAISVLDNLAKRNDSKALYMLGKISELQWKTDDMLLYWTKAAEQGYLEAQYSLASHYNNDKDKQRYWANKALQQYKKMANNGDSDAMVYVGNLYDSGWLEEGESRKKAIEWYDKAADLENTEAMDKLGWLYWFDHNIEKSFEYFLKGAKLGDLDCRLGVGQVIYNYGKEHPEWGDGFTLFCTALFQDDERINPWYYKAASMGSPQAEASIGWWILLDGRFEEAKQRLEKAKNGGINWITTVYGYQSLKTVLGATCFYVKNPSYKHEFNKGNFIEGANSIYLICKKENRFGVVKIDNSGNLLNIHIPFKYDSIYFNNDMFYAEKNGEEEVFMMK